jgi:hypothetical protein
MGMISGFFNPWPSKKDLTYSEGVKTIAPIQKLIKLKSDHHAFVKRDQANRTQRILEGP